MNQLFAAATTFTPSPHASFPAGEVRYLDGTLSNYVTAPMLTLGVTEALGESFNTGWNGSTNDTVVIHQDLGEARSADFYIVQGYFGTSSIYRPIAAHLEYSDDDSSWTTVENFTGLGDGGQPGGQNWLIRWDTSAEGSHRYWRVTLTHGGTWVFVDAIRFGGPVVSYGRAITLSVTPSGTYPAPAVDVLESGDSDYSNDVSNQLLSGRRAKYSETFAGQYTGWTAATDATRSATIDLGSAIPADYVYITGYYGSALISRPSAIKLEYSDNGSSWTTQEDKSGLTAGGAPGARRWTARFTVTGETHQYWRLTFTVVADWLFVGSIDFVSGWVNHAAGMPYTISPTADGNFPDNQPVALLTGSDWESSTGGKLTNSEVGNYSDFTTAVGWSLADDATGTVRVDMGTDRGGSYAVLYGQQGNGSAMRTPEAIAFEYSDNDSDWTSVFSKTGLTVVHAGKGRWVAAADISSAGEHQYWRAIITSNGDGPYYAVDQFELWDEVSSSSGATVTPSALANSLAVGTVGASGGAATTTTAVPSVLAFNTPTVSGGATTAPDAVLGALNVGSPSVAGGVLVTPNSLASVLNVDTPTVTGGATIAPSAVVMSLLIPSVTVSVDASANINVDAVAGTLTFNAPVVTGGADAVLTAVAGALLIPNVGLSAGSTVSVNAITGVLTVDTPVVSSSVDVLVAAVLGSLNIDTAAVAAGSTVTPDAIALTISIPTPTVTTVIPVTYRRLSGVIAASKDSGNITVDGQTGTVSSGRQTGELN